MAKGRVDAFYLFAVGAIIGVAALVTTYLGTALTRVADSLPIEVLEQERGVGGMIGKLEDAVQAFESLEATPGPGSRVAALVALDAASDAASDIRRSYNLDNLLGAAALHAAVSPAIDDALRWTREGVAGRPADAPFVVGLALTRLKEALNESRALSERSRAVAESALRLQAEQVKTIRERAIAGMVAFVLFAATLASLVLRQRRLLAEREAAVEEAHRANRAKSEFLAHMSHELRTPLNAVIGFAEMIEKRVLGPAGADKYPDYAKDIRESAEHLLAIIGDILDLSKIEAGQMTLDESAFDPVAQANSAMRLSAGRAKAKGLDIRVVAQPGLPLLRADARAFRRILINLLANAVKFTHVGRIDLRIAVETGNRLSVAVEDTGIGMAEHEIPLARRPFGQVRNFLTRDIEGTGLGLPLSEQLAKVHGATLTIESAKGRGTKVVVVFPPERTVPRPGVAS